MSDGFHFGPKQPRREARQFEVPPWEREAFEKHKCEQEERAEAERALIEALEEAAAKDLPTPSAAPAEPAAATEAQASESAQPAQAGETVAKPPLDDGQVERLMLELRASEPRTLTRLWMVVFGAGVLIGVLGVAIGVWGIVAMAKAGDTTRPAATVLMFFGLGSIGIGGWLMYTGLQRRGVL